MLCELRRRSPRLIKPIGGRFFVSLVVVGVVACAFSTSGAAETPMVVTEDEVVSKALGEESLIAMSKAQVMSKEAKATGVASWSNPRLRYEREQVFSGGTSAGEDTLVVQQEIPLAGRKRLRAQAWREQGRVAELEGLAKRRAHAAEMRVEFFRLLEAQERIEVYEQWLGLMADVEEELQRRVVAGESAPYELHRLQKEVADIRAASAIERGDLVAQRVRLAMLLEVPGAKDSIQADGELMPSIPEDSAILSALAAHPEMVAVTAKFEAAEALEEAAGRWWIPNPTIEAGYKGAGTDAHGFVVGLSLALPLFGAQGKAGRLAAEALRMEAEQEREFALHHHGAEIIGQAHRVRILVAAAEEYKVGGVVLASKVVETARIAYAAGELGILELIDGYRGLVQARLTMVQMAAKARQDEITMWESMYVPDKEDDRVQEVKP